MFLLRNKKYPTIILENPPYLELLRSASQTVKHQRITQMQQFFPHRKCAIKLLEIHFSLSFWQWYLLYISVKKQTEEQDVQAKPARKAKELKVLDPKSAQNLCKIIIVCLWYFCLIFLSICSTMVPLLSLAKIQQGKERDGLGLKVSPGYSGPLIATVPIAFWLWLTYLYLLCPV